MKRVIVHGLTGSSWQFKWFDTLPIIVNDADKKNYAHSSLTKKMEFINFEASEELKNEDLIFSDDENNNGKKKTDNFLDDSTEVNNNEQSFCRQFANQIQNPKVAIYDGSDDEEFLDVRDLQPKL